MDFAKQDKNAMNPEGTISANKGIGIHICSEEEWKLSWMRETRIRCFMQMKLDASRNVRLANKVLFMCSQRSSKKVLPPDAFADPPVTIQI